MIEVTFTINLQGQYTKVELTGHADYADHGSDIVCAAVSAAVYGISNAIIVKSKARQLVQDDKDRFTIINNDTSCGITYHLLDTLLIMVNGISEQYPDNVSVTKLIK